MLGYIIAVVGIVVVIAVVMAMRGGAGAPKSGGEPRPDEKKGASYDAPQAEQTQTAEQQAHRSE